MHRGLQRSNEVCSAEIGHIGMKARREHVHVYFAVEHGFLELELAERRKLNPQTGERFRRFFGALGSARVSMW